MPETIDTMRLKPGLRDRTRTITVRACTRCGARITNCRCAPLANIHDADHRNARRQTLDEEFICWRCDKPGTPTDPLEADHVIARIDGGTNTRSNYRAAHRSCNRRAGAAKTNGGA